MNKLYFLLAYLVVSLFAFITPVAHAETHITDDTSFDSDTTWTKDGSPYVIDGDVYVPHGIKITIDSGVTVTTSTSSPGSLSIGGTIFVDGDAGQPVVIDNLKGFSIWYADSTSTISDTVIDVPAGLQVIKSNLVISSTTITGADKGITAQGSSIIIGSSSISENNYGVYSISMPVYQAFNIFGPSVAYAQTIADRPNENHILISNSSLGGNSIYDIFNSTTNVINAENNWWGSVDGPGPMVSGNVDYIPWLAKDPTMTNLPTICCSNVLFLPGLEASRLYLDQKLYLGTSTNELWEPGGNDDVRKLFMTSSGQSITSGIYTKDVIDTILGVYPVYKNFIAMMNGVVAEKTINSWLPFPYDWRFDAAFAVSNKLVAAVQSLASSSKTGKVTIVAHSNGGLVAKLLAKTLADMGKSNLLDKVILVAVPQLGTPEAIAGLLHGDDEDILGGIITTQSVMRQLGENMPSGYGLLPSRAYFAGVNDSLVSIASSAASDFNLRGDGRAILNYDSLRSFLTGGGDHREQPSDADTNSPALLHSAMIDSAQKIHDIIDSFSFASATKPVILAGWDKNTLSGISYYEEISCSAPVLMSLLGVNQNCTKTLKHSASTTRFGDGTVVLQSAAASISSSSDYYFDLGAESKGKLIADDHSTILNTDSGVGFVKQEVTDQGRVLPPYISSTAPTEADIHDDELTVSVHSPVELNMYDSHGNHTGPIPNPIPGSDLGMFETNIPGSEYVQNDDDTHIVVPYGTDYRVTFSGTGMGSFEVDTKHNVNDVDVESSTFADMPVTPLLKAELILATTTQIEGTSTALSSATSSISTTTQMIVFDFNGDGVTDATSTPHSQYDPILDLESDKVIVSSLNLSPSKEKIMRDKLSSIIDCLRKKKPLKEVAKPNMQAIHEAEQAMADLHNQHWIFKNLDSDRKQKLEDIFQAFLDNVETEQ